MTVFLTKALAACKKLTVCSSQNLIARTFNTNDQNLLDEFKLKFYLVSEVENLCFRKTRFQVSKLKVLQNKVHLFNLTFGQDRTQNVS